METEAEAKAEAETEAEAEVAEAPLFDKLCAVLDAQLQAHPKDPATQLAQARSASRLIEILQVDEQVPLSPVLVASRTVRPLAPLKLHICKLCRVQTIIMHVRAMTICHHVT